MRRDRFPQILRPAVVQEEYPLAQTPERCGTELVTTSCSLKDVVRQTGAHRMERQVGEQIHVLVAERRDGRVTCAQSRRMTIVAADAVEESPAAGDGRCTARCRRRGRRRCGEAHEECKLL